MKTKKSSSLKTGFFLKKVKIAIVLSRFNEAITKNLLQGALRAFEQEGIPKESIQVIEVPGAFEIPLAAKLVAQKKKPDGIICLGAVIRGETPHFDYICLAATQGILQVELETKVPIAFGILTTNTIEQAVARATPDKNNKGYEAAKVVLEMIGLSRKLNGKSA